MTNTIKKFLILIAGISCLYTANANAAQEKYSVPAFAKVLETFTRNNTVEAQLPALDNMIRKASTIAAADQMRGMLMRNLGYSNLFTTYNRIKDLERLVQETTAEQEKISTTKNTLEQQMAQLRSNMSDLQRQNMTLKQQVTNLKKQSDEAELVSETESEANLSLKAQLNEKESELAATRDMLAKLEQDRATQSAALANVQARLKEINNQQRITEENNDSLKRQVTLLQQQLQQEKDARAQEAMKNRVASQELTQLRIEHAKLTTEFQTNVKVLRDQINQNQRFQEENRALIQNYEQLQQENKNLQALNLTLTTENNLINIQNRELRTELDTLRQELEQERMKPAVKPEIIERVVEKPVPFDNPELLTQITTLQDELAQARAEKAIPAKPAVVSAETQTTEPIYSQEGINALERQLRDLQNQLADKEREIEKFGKQTAPAGIELSKPVRTILTTLLENVEVPVAANTLDLELQNLVDKNEQEILELINLVPQLQKDLNIKRSELRELSKAIQGFRAYVRLKTYWEKIGQSLLNALKDPANLDKTIREIALKNQQRIQNWLAKFKEIEGLQVQKFTPEDINKILDTYIKQLGLTESTLTSLGQPETAKEALLRAQAETVTKAKTGAQPAPAQKKSASKKKTKKQ